MGLKRLGLAGGNGALEVSLEDISCPQTHLLSTSLPPSYYDILLFHAPFAKTYDFVTSPKPLDQETLAGS